MKRQNEVIDWNKYLRYEDGKLYWKEREGNDRITKMWNKQNAGNVVGCLDSRGYRVVMLRPKKYYAHRIIWEMHNGTIPKGKEIDHIDCDKDNNKLSNLQVLTSKQNTDRRNHICATGWAKSKRKLVRPYISMRTNKLFGTPCGAYMSYATAFLQGEMDGNSR